MLPWSACTEICEGLTKDIRPLQDSDTLLYPHDVRQRWSMWLSGKVIRLCILAMSSVPSNDADACNTFAGNIYFSFELEMTREHVGRYVSLSIGILIGSDGLL